MLEYLVSVKHTIITYYHRIVDSKLYNHFDKAPSLNQVVSVVDVNNGTIALTLDGTIYHNDDTCKQFIPVNLPERVSMIFGRHYTCALITVSGQLYMKGDNFYGELGLGDFLTRQDFTRIPFPYRAVKVEIEYSRTCVTATHGQVYWCGIKDDVMSPRLIPY